MKRFLILDINYSSLQKIINKYISNGWTIYKMDNIFNINKYKVFFSKDLSEENTIIFDNIQKKQ